MARATFRQRPPTRGIRAPASDAAARRFSNNPNGWGSMSPPSQSIPGRPVPLSDSLRIVAGGRQAPRTLSTASPNSRSRTPPRSATGIRADARAYTPARDGALREKACSTGQPAKAEPSRLCEGPPTASSVADVGGRCSTTPAACSLLRDGNRDFSPAGRGLHPRLEDGCLRGHRLVPDFVTGEQVQVCLLDQFRNLRLVLKGS